MRVRQAMTKEVFCVAPAATVLEVAQLMKDRNIGFMSVCEQPDQAIDLVGVVTDRDIIVDCIALGHAPGNCAIQHVMTKRIHTVPADMDIHEACRLMAKEHVRRLPVVENRRVIGLVSLSDIALIAADDPVIGDTLRQVHTPARLSFVAS